MIDVVTRRSRKEQRKRRVHMTAASMFLLAIGLLLFYLSPSSSDMPVMTVYFDEGCTECGRWAQQMARRGLRTVMGLPSELDEVRARTTVPAALRAPVVAVVGDYVLQGLVPAHEIHLLVRGRFGKSVRGLVVPGMPSGVPRITAGLPRPYTVYALYAGGLVRPIKTYNDSFHRHTSASTHK